jgi:hypothetical protein
MRNSYTIFERWESRYIFNEDTFKDDNAVLQ